MRYLFFALLIVSTISCNNDKPIAEEMELTKLDSLNERVRSEKSATAYLARAIFHLQERELRLAQIDVDSAMILEPENTDVLLERGNVYYYLNQSRYSRDSWEECVRIDPQQMECRMKLAELYFVVQNYQPALNHLNVILENDGSDPIALFLKGNIYREMGDTAQAVLFMQRAVEEKTDYFEAFDMLGVVYAEKNSLRALDYYGRALELQPDNADLYYKIGLFHQNRNDYNAAIEAYTKSVQLDPAQKYAYFNLGYIHIELQVYSTALEYFTGAINSDERYYQAYYGRAYCLEILGDVQNAKLDYETSLNINMEYEPAKEGLGRVSKLIEENPAN